MPKVSRKRGRGWEDEMRAAIERDRVSQEDKKVAAALMAAAAAASKKRTGGFVQDSRIDDRIEAESKRLLKAEANKKKEYDARKDPSSPYYVPIPYHGMPDYSKHMRGPLTKGGNLLDKLANLPKKSSEDLVKYWAKPQNRISDGGYTYRRGQWFKDSILGSKMVDESEVRRHTPLFVKRWHISHRR